MKNITHKSLLIAICATTIIGCKPKLDEFPEASANGVDFSKYIAIGDGTPAGYTNASLNRDAQLAAYPNLLAEQFKLVGGGAFYQPLVKPFTSPITKQTYTSFGFEAGKPYTKYNLRYRTFCDGKTELYPTMEDSSIYLQNDLISILSFEVEPPPAGGGYNNFAAQGTRMIYANKNTAWSGTSDTYWKKISDGGNKDVFTKSMVQEAAEQNPTFLSINLGIVDVMRYGKSGGNQEVAPGPTNDDFITEFPEFHDSLYSMMNIFTKNNTNGLKGCISNIIDLDAFPYITHIKYDGLILTQTEADDLNTYYSTNFPANNFTFQAGRNAYVVEDNDATNGRRRIKANEYLIVEVPQDSLRCHELGAKVPIWKRWLLDETEIAKINTAIDGYNSILKAAAKAYNFAYVDGNDAMDLVKEGRNFQGIPLKTDFVTGNQFSLDGLNISPLGQVMLANNAITEINILYGSSIPLIDVTTTPSIIFQ